MIKPIEADNESGPTEPSQKIHRYPCPACGADLLYEPKDGCLICPYCGHSEAIPDSAEQVEERSFEKYLHIRPEQLEQLAANALEVRCQSCGATVTFTPPEVARQCDFCGVQIVAQAKSADPILAPEAILPFRFTRPQANEGLRQWLGSRWFAPNALKNFARPDAIDGVYLPFWTYDTNTTSYYTGERGEHYYVTETYHETDSQGRRFNVLDRCGILAGTAHPVRSSAGLMMCSSQPQCHCRKTAWKLWNPGTLPNCSHTIRRFFRASRRNVIRLSLARVSSASSRWQRVLLKAMFGRDIGGDEQRIHDVATHYSGITFKHLLLPVYAGAYRFNQKIYQIVVNGRTGEIQGDRPYSAWKIALFVAAMLFVVLIIALVFSLAEG